MSKKTKAASPFFNPLSKEHAAHAVVLSKACTDRLRAPYYLAALSISKHC
jgi:hypothetical protein